MNSTDLYPSRPGGDGRPEGLPDHLPYVCRTTGRVCIDRVPCTQEEIRACGNALRAIYTRQSGAT